MPYTFAADPDVTDRVISTAAGYTLYGSNGLDEGYDSGGKLIWIQPDGGRRQTLTYDASGRLQTVTDFHGRSLTFTYNTQGTVATVTDPAGDIYSYQYDAHYNLTAVSKPPVTVGGSPLTRHYVYEDASFPHALTGILDEDGNRYATWSYNSQGRAVSAQLAGGARNYSFSYGTGSTLITDPLGTARTFTFQTLHGVEKTVSISGGKCDICGTSAQTRYDTNGFVSSRTDFDGNVTTYSFNSRGLETSRTEAYGTPEARTITTVWDANYRLPTRITTPTRTTTFQYDSHGNLLQKTVTPNTGPVQIWTYTYDSNGLLTRVTGPRTDVTQATTYAYGSQGDLTQVTNALGQVTRITAYDANGRPLSVTDPSGLVTTYTYDPLSRLTSRDRGGLTTTYTYDGVGNLTSVTLPGGVTYTYTYDAAHRLIRIADATGDSIRYTLDAMGNRIKTQYLDAGGQVSYTHRQVFNALDRLYQDIGAANQTTTYAYDANGNQVQRTDPLGHTAAWAYDALNRVRQVTDALNGITTYTYDPTDALVSVTDPDGNTTTDTNDGFGNHTRVQSPDSGTSTDTYDAAGNRLTHTDARGITLTYTYDALNRLTHVDAPGAADDITYTYDTCPNGVGRLCTVTTAATTVQYGYDALGQLVSDQGLSYAYDAAGRLASMTYPSGAVVTYGYDADGRVQRVQLTVGGATQILASGIHYRPFGPVDALTYGSGQSLTQAYDGDYRMQSQAVPGILGITYGPYDGQGNLLQRTDTRSGAVSGSFSYDGLGRLIGASGGYGARSYHYDANGNRTELDTGGTVIPYAYSAGSNRLSQAGTDTVVLDAAGNTVQKGPWRYTYTAQERLKAVYEGGVLKATYTYNGLGQRVAKTLPAGTVRYVYGPGGRMLAQTDASGEALDEYFYLNGRPLAVLRHDQDGDGVPDDRDDCIAVPNGPLHPDVGGHSQRDTSGDGYGNLCDADFDHNGIVNFADLAYIKAHFGTSDPDADLDGNGIVNFADLAITKSLFGNPPGPSGLHGQAGPPQLLYVNTDALGAPVALSNVSGTTVWQASYTPFGQATINPDPGGDGKKVTFNLRFSGQYYDRESGLYYNYFRDYDPSTGRYVESDPIGLAAGTNLYAYVRGDPLRWVDPKGLASIAFGSGGSFQYYFWGGSAQSGFAFDTKGNACFYTTTCKTKAFGTEIDLGPSVALSKENLCSGTKKSTSYFVSGGKAIYEGGEISKDGVSRGLHGGIGYGSAAGKNICTTVYHCLK